MGKFRTDNYDGRVMSGAGLAVFGIRHMSRLKAHHCERTAGR
jgi:hypothetical protein